MRLNVCRNLKDQGYGDHCAKAATLQKSTKGDKEEYRPKGEVLVTTEEAGAKCSTG